MLHLTHPQKLIYDMEKFSGGAISVICGSMIYHCRKDIPEMKKAVNELFRLNDALRIRVSESDGTAFQYVEDFQEKEIEVLSFKDKAELDDYANTYAKEPIDIFGSLCEIKLIELDEGCGLICKLHHLIGDAWTLSLIGSQFNKLLNGEAPECYSYCDYISAEEKYINGKRYVKDSEFFVEQFKKCDEVTFINEKQAKSMLTDRKTFVIDKNKTKAITEYAQRNNSSVFTLLLTALSVYINRTKMNVEKFYIGIAVLNRLNAKEKNTMGMFINTVPVLIELNNDNAFSINAESVQDSVFSVLRHQKYNYGDILDELRRNFNFGEKLYDVMLSYQNAKITNGEDNFESTWYHCGMQTESLQIHIDDRDNEGILTIHYDYLTEKFSEHDIELLHEHIFNILFDAIENDGKKIYELNILTEDEKQKLLYDFNNTAIDYPKDKCVHELFEEQVAKTADKTAVIACDKTLTYAELNEQANRIANTLIQKGIGVGDIVAFLLPRRSYLLAAMLGALKSGAAYLPIDPDHPQDRIEYMLSDSGAKLCITEENIYDLLANENSHNPNVNIERNNYCYCIYTSGSTGNPKGTLLTHKNVTNYVNNNNNVVHKIIKSDYQRIISVTTVGFDIFVTESLLPLTNGMEILLASESQAKLQSELNSLIQAYPVDVLQTTPTKMKSLIADKAQLNYLKQIRVIILGGEALDEVLVRELQEITSAEIYNIYGPTEATVWVTNVRISHANDITIGKPVANTQIYIVDKYMEPTPIGVTGELCIAGDCVGVGYLNRPELTAEKFIDNPFGNGKIYKTGDLAYWREDGNIVYVGRNDFQVKIRGLRIELEEIENAICGVNGISQTVVVVRKNNEGRLLICAFYTGIQIDAKEIRSIIGNKLPKYMLPHIFSHLDEIPLTTSGKINRKVLPEIGLENITNDTEHVAPETNQQKELCRLMETVLGMSPVGITDDFFDLGGDSLKAIEFVSKAHSEGIYFNLQNIFDYPTVQKLCDYIESGDKQDFSFADVDFTEVNRILAKNILENMTVPQKTEVGNILLAGATGFLGIHILADFLDHDTGTAYCLVRGKDKVTSTQRLNELLSFYFGDTYSNLNRIEVVCADLQKDKFGLSDEDYIALFDKIDTVINCAASVKHYGSYKYFYEANVETTKRLIEFCKAANAKLIHTSTLSVSGNSFGDDFDGYISETEKHFYESSLYVGQPLENVYARSKFEAEKAVLDAMAEGLQANIMRMGNLTNRLSDGVFQRNHESNAFGKRVKAVLEMGIIPDYLMSQYVEFTAIDEAASAVMTIARHFSTEQTVFHINSTKVVYLNRLLGCFNVLGYPLKVVIGAEFTNALRQTAKQSGMEHIFETFINDMDENDHLNYDSNIRIENAFTEQYLNQLGFYWSEIGLDYLRKYVEYFKKIEYLKQEMDR